MDFKIKVFCNLFLQKHWGNIHQELWYQEDQFLNTLSKTRMLLYRKVQWYGFLHSLFIAIPTFIRILMISIPRISPKTLLTIVIPWIIWPLAMDQEIASVSFYIQFLILIFFIFVSKKKKRKICIKNIIYLKKNIR